MSSWTFVLVAPYGGDPANAIEPLRRVGAAVARSIADAAPSVQLCTRIPDDLGGPDGDAYAGILRGGLSNGVRLGGFDVVLRVDVPEPSGERLVGAVVDHAGALGAIDRASCSLVTGPEAVVKSPVGPVTLVYCMWRAPGIEHDEFSAAWRRHAEIAETTPNIRGYRQLHASLPSSAYAASELGLPNAEIDGVVTASFESVRAFSGAVGGPQTFTQPSLESERRFNDITRARAALTRVAA